MHFLLSCLYWDLHSSSNCEIFLHGKDVATSLSNKVHEFHLAKKKKKKKVSKFSLLELLWFFFLKKIKKIKNKHHKFSSFHAPFRVKMIFVDRGEAMEMKLFFLFGCVSTFMIVTYCYYAGIFLLI